MTEKAIFKIYSDKPIPARPSQFFYSKTWRNFMNDHPPDDIYHRADERILNWRGRRVGDIIEFETEKDLTIFLLRWS